MPLHDIRQQRREPQEAEAVPEAVREGFKAAYGGEGDYHTIVDVAEKLPRAVLQEDEKLLIYYDMASVR